MLQALLAFKFSSEKSGIILTGFPLYVTCGFFLWTLSINILSVFCILNVVLTMIYHGDLLSCSGLFGVLIVSSVWACLYSGKLSSMILLKIYLWHWFEILLPLTCLLSKGLLFPGVSRFPFVVLFSYSLFIWLDSLLCL